MSEPLPTIGYISHIVADAMRDPTSGINITQLRAEPNGCVSEALVFRSDALAKLAEKDAEIARLRDGLARIEKQANEYPGDDASALGWIVSECDALKGPEA